ncbi:NAD-capped RNA hydrolase NUDT12-like isoform X3 [Xenia sp. Carnegie-2017]|nr:NAD-capped RNA hydrolase NUDT12-like isoform X3 [Xenia sp. Carnegie-2017]
MRDRKGLTATDIAKNNGSIATLNVLKHYRQFASVGYPSVNYFSHVPLNRMAEKRKDKVWLDQQMKNPKSMYVIFNQLKPLARKVASKKTFCLVKVNFRQLSEILGKQAEEIKNVVFLGVEETYTNSCKETSLNKAIDCNISWFAVDVGDISDASDKFLKENPNTEYLSPRPGFLQVNAKDATILAQARPILEWHQFNKFCSRCGSKVSIEEAGYKQSCSNEQCATKNKILNVSYPRTDPVGIMLVVSHDGTQCLLGRKASFPVGMYSCLAGFMEPGESIEDAVRREVMEESGISVGPVKYHSSQFWPYPAQLMIGCIAHANTSHIVIDKEELDDIQWFNLDSVRQACYKKIDISNPPSLWFPPRQAIARQLIEHWVDTYSDVL